MEFSTEAKLKWKLEREAEVRGREPGPPIFFWVSGNKRRNLFQMLKKKSEAADCGYKEPETNVPEFREKWAQVL